MSLKSTKRKGAEQTRTHEDWKGGHGSGEVGGGSTLEIAVAALGTSVNAGFGTVCPRTRSTARRSQWLPGGSIHSLRKGVSSDCATLWSEAHCLPASVGVGDARRRWTHGWVDHPGWGWDEQE